MFLKSVTDWLDERKQAALCETETCTLVLTEKYECEEGCKKFVCEVLRCPHCGREDMHYYMLLSPKEMTCVLGPKAKTKKSTKKIVAKKAEVVK